MTESDCYQMFPILTLVCLAVRCSFACIPMKMGDFEGIDSIPTKNPPIVVTPKPTVVIPSLTTTMPPEKCGPLSCRIDDLYDVHLKVLPPQKQLPFQKFQYPEEKSLRCNYPSTTILNFTCQENGLIYPKPRDLSCDLPAWWIPQIPLPGNGPIRASCKECHHRGTAACQKVPGGVRCICNAYFHRYTCDMSINQCLLKGNPCQNGGDCIHMVDHRLCSCKVPFVGTRCEKDASKITWNGEGKSISYVSPASVMSLLLFVAMAYTHLYRIFKGDDSETWIDRFNPQKNFVQLRNYVLIATSFWLVCFARPAIFLSNRLDYRLWTFLIYSGFFLAQALHALEAQNVCYLVKGISAEKWETDAGGVKRWWLTVHFRLLLPVFALFIVTSFVAYQYWNDMILYYSCLGTLREQTIEINFFLHTPLIALVVGTLHYAVDAFTTDMRNSELVIGIVHRLETTDPGRLAAIQRVLRNRPFQWVMCPLLYCIYVGLQGSIEYETTGNVFFDTLTIVATIGYIVVHFVQCGVINDDVLESWMRTYVYWLPNLPWPELSPMQRLNKEELISLWTGKKPEGSYFHPSIEDYLSEDTRTHFFRELTSFYLSRRMLGISWEKAREETLKRDPELYEGPHSEARQLRVLADEWIRQITIWDRYVLKVDRRPVTTQQQVAEKVMNRPHLGRSQVMEEDRIVAKMGEMREMLGYRKTAGTDSVELLAESETYGKGYVEWQKFRAASPPVRLRSQLPALRKRFQEMKPKIQKHLEEKPDSAFSLWYKANDYCPDYDGVCNFMQKDPNPYKLPGAADFVEIAFYDSLTNAMEWEKARKWNAKQKEVGRFHNLEPEVKEAKIAERDRLAKINAERRAQWEKDPWFEEDKWMAEPWELLYKQQNVNAHWHAPRPPPFEPYEPGVYEPEGTPQFDANGVRALRMDRPSEVRKRQRRAQQQALTGFTLDFHE